MTPQANEIQCPTCPLCASEPLPMLVGLAQAFCPSDDCQVFCWDPYSTKEANLSDMGQVRHFINGVEQLPD